jgi:putative hydrolase of the HAD superfamily
LAVILLIVGLSEPFVDFIINPVRRMNNHMPSREKKMVFFDAGETLVHPLPSFPELFKSICADYRFEVDLSLLPKLTRSLMEEVEKKQRSGYTFTDNPERSMRFWHDFYGALLKGLGYDNENGVLSHALFETFSEPSNYGAYEDAVESIRELDGMGIRMGLISNFEPWLEKLLYRLGLKDYFQVVIISGHEGFEKPHPRIFQIAIERSGIASESALHVGDSPVSDYQGASEAGMDAVLLDRWGRFPDFSGARITSLLELPSFITGNE